MTKRSALEGAGAGAGVGLSVTAPPNSGCRWVSNYDIAGSRRPRQAECKSSRQRFLIIFRQTIWLHPRRALADAAARGVKVRIYLDAGQLAHDHLDRLLAMANIAVKVKESRVLMHLKAYDVDGEVLRTGAGNLSRSGLTEQDNDLIILFDNDEIAAFEKDFERMWERPSNRVVDAVTQ